MVSSRYTPGVKPYITMNREKCYRITVCRGPHCEFRGQAAVSAQLQASIWEHELEEQVEVHSSGCQDHCDVGPNMIIRPGPYRYAGLTVDAARQIVVAHLRDDRPAQDWLVPPVDNPVDNGDL